MDERDLRHLIAARESAVLARTYVIEAGDRWFEDQKTIDATAKRVEEVGEHLSRVSRPLQAATPDLPWMLARAMRNRLVHEYGHIDLETLEGVVMDDLPAIILAIEALLD